MTSILALFTALALAAPAKVAAPNTRSIRRARPRQATPAEGLLLKGKLEALITAAGGNRTAASAGNARARAWIKAEAEAINKLVPGAWQIEEREFTPAIDYAIRSHKADFAKFSAAGPDTV